MEVAGAQQVLLSQARGFHERGYPVRAVFFYDKQGLEEKWQQENRSRRHAVGKQPEKNLCVADKVIARKSIGCGQGGCQGNQGIHAHVDD